MGGIFESKFVKALQRGGEKIAGNRGFSAISSGMMGMMAVILTGAVFQIIANLPVIFKLIDTNHIFYKIMLLPYDMTMGLIALYLAFAIAYHYSKKLDGKPMMDAIVSAVLFVMVAAPVQKVEMAAGGTFTGLSTAALGSVGMFSSIIIALCSVRITTLFRRRNIVIKMPDVVPQFLSDSFSALLPLAANVILWYGLNLVIGQVFTDRTLPTAINAVLSIPIGALVSVPGMFVAIFLCCLLWLFGIHGGMVVYMAMLPIIIQNTMKNAAAVSAGEPRVFYATSLLIAVACAGGNGNTLGMVLYGLRSKSAQIKAVSKASIIPGLFNINEPVTFGFPIMYNPVLAIPYLLVPQVTCLILWAGYSVGFFQPNYIVMMSLMPLGVSEFMGSLAWQNLLIPVVGLVVGLVIYYPFFKVYEKQLVEKEAAAAAATK